MKIIQLSLILLLLFISCFTQANTSSKHVPNNQFQLSDPLFQKVIPKNNIILGNIRSIQQDSFGFIWLASASGLFRYDGEQFLHYPLPSSPNVFDMLEHDGNLWISTLDHGLYSFNLSTHEVTIFNATSSEVARRLPSNSLSQLSISDNLLWVTSSKGIAQIDLATKTTVTDTELLSYLPSNLNTKDILMDSKARLWIATLGSGLYMWRTTDNTLHHFSDASSAEQKVNSANVSHIVEDHNGKIWIGTFNGVQYYDEKLKRFIEVTAIENKSISSLTINSNGEIWVGTWEQELYKIAPNSTTANLVQPKLSVQETVTSIQIYNTFEDSAGHEWFASNNAIFQLTSSSKAFTHLYNIKNEPCYIRGLSSRVDDDLWFSCNTQLLLTNTSLTDQPTTRFTAHDEISKVHLDNRLNLWLTFFRGNDLVMYNPEKDTHKHFRPNTNSGLNGGVVLAITSAQNGSLWVGTYAAHIPDLRGQLLLYDPVKDQFVQQLTIDVITITPLNDGTLLLVSPDGIFNYHPKTKENIRVDPANNVSGIGRVNSQFKDSNGDVWFSIYEVGLLKYSHRTHSLSFAALPSRLKNIEFQTITADENNNLWLGSQNTLYKYSPKNQTVSTLSSQDGLNIESVMMNPSLFSKDKELLVADINSIVKIELEKIPSSQLTAPTVLTQLKVKNQPILLQFNNEKTYLQKALHDSDKLTLSHEDYFFSLSFRNLNFTNQKLKYSYKLTGLDDDWVYTSDENKVATYTTLPEGKYSFVVRTENLNDQLISESKPLVIKIEPPFWRTWSAYFVYLLVLLTAVYLFIRVKTKALKVRTKMLEVGIQERTTELEKRSKTIESLLDTKKQLFANISHEFRTPLTLIIGPADKLLDTQADSTLLSQASLIKSNAQRLLYMVEQLLELAKIDSPVQVDKQRYHLNQNICAIIAAFQLTLENKSQSLVFKTTFDCELELDRDSLDKILLNLVSNSTKYTLPGGKIEISTSFDNDGLAITVSDTGVGISPKEQASIFEPFVRANNEHTNYEVGTGIGLALVKELVQANGGHISVDSTLGKGTSFTITFPQATILKVITDNCDYSISHTLNAQPTDITMVANQLTIQPKS